MPSEDPYRQFTVKTSAEWRDYYTRNAEERLHVPWERGAELTPAERTAIAESLRAWQLGETSDGRHLLAAAEQYARQQGDPAFLDAVRLFIAEEQRHGAEIGRFLDLAAIPRLAWNWGDAAFRACRYAVPSMELWATTVIMVESLALVYYKAVYDATGSAALRGVCRQILKDEVMHIRFQYERLAILHRRRPAALLEATHLLQRLFFAGVVTAVWFGHRRALRAGGHGFGSFWQAAWKRMRIAWQLMRPEAYRWDEEPEYNPRRSPEPIRMS